MNCIIWRIKRLKLQKNKKLRDNIINLVDRIIEGKKSGIDMRELEEEVDRLVYKLYGLTEAEINIIENR